MKTERGISRKTGNTGKQERLRASPEMNQVEKRAKKDELAR